MEFSVTVKDKVRLIRFERPHRKNAMTVTMYTGIQKAIEEANDDENTHLVVITGSGDYFSSGNDLGNYTTVSDVKQVEEAVEMVRKYVDAFIDCRKPIIALVNGPAVGIAVTVLGLCDVVLATTRAAFKTPFTSLGLSPEGCSSYVFPRIMGHAKACQLIYFCEEMDAEEALRVGLVSQLIPDHEFQTLSWKKIQRWLELPINSIISAKALVRDRERDLLHKVNKDECQRLLERILSEDCMEAILKYFSSKSKI